MTHTQNHMIILLDILLRGKGCTYDDVDNVGGALDDVRKSLETRIQQGDDVTDAGQHLHAVVAATEGGEREEEK